ncbi:hypothetical protein PR202_gb09070 [Eleusine coracana subsp. coracana]|uniref:Filament-like plant protein 7 n=1 Tax=Eleusine coracana subsp. coracana TaxID=191504 RepID=A0AAV5EDY4_ELECO|nr:hypothetical protein QOZ80_2BG0193010 [Eleusine coracana subsp. coracana]GJN21583.1 hypothetical protein PR202_gb09070 [Eleusine coracana subsp. coracana]
MTEMEEALRSCMEQLVTAREEREQVIVEASNEISSEKKKARELQRELDDANKKAAKLAADNAGLRKAVDAKDALVGELRASEAAARDELAGAVARLESAQKQAGSLRYEVRMLQKELEVRAQEREYDLKAADAARRQQAEHLDRIARLEAECQRLRAMVRKRLPGPAAIAKMRDEVDQALTPRASPRRPRPATPSSPRSVASSPFTPRTPSPRRSVSSEADGYAFKLRAVEDENRALKQALAKRESELQILQMKYADEACRFTAVQRQLKDLTEENRQLSDANCQSESWASALISELEQFRSGSQNGASIMASSDMSLLDDFAEMEKMEMESGDRKKNSPRASSKQTDMGSVKPEQNGNDLAVNGKIPNGHPERVQDVWQLVMQKHESSGESVDTILEEMRHALDQKTISTEGEDSDVSYDRSEVEKVVRDLIEELTSVIGASAEDKVARSRPLLTDKSELCSRFEHLVQVCHEQLGKVNLEKFIDEICLILKYTLSQYYSIQKQSYAVESNTKDSDEGRLTMTDRQVNNDTHGAKPAAALDNQEEAQEEPIQSDETQITVSHQEKLDKEITGYVLGPDDDIPSPTAEASVKDWAAQEEELLTANSDIQAAADKLAECQETITILNKQLQALTTPATYKPQSLASILAEGSADANGSKSPTTSKQVQFKEEHDAFSAVPKMSSEQEQNATAENKDSIQLVVHPVFGEPRQEDVSADPGKKKKRSSSLLGRIMFRKKVEGSS